MDLSSDGLMLGVGYVLLRMLDASALMLVSSNVINQWSEARRGRTVASNLTRTVDTIKSTYRPSVKQESYQGLFQTASLAI